MKRDLLLGLLVPTMLLGPSAFADDKAACVDASSKAQRLRDSHKLVEAREQLRLCAAARCPAVIQSDCATWLNDLENALPSVVLAAKSLSGADLFEVSVSVDGQPLVTKLDGRAVTMNAGPHTFHFEGADGASVDRQVLIKEGDKNQAVAVVLGSNADTMPLPRSVEPVDEGPKPSSSWKTVGWILGGVGVVGIGVGAVAGVVAIERKSAHCTNGACDSGTLGALNTATWVADVGFIAGGALFATGAGILLLAPRGRQEHAAGVRLAPVVTARGGALMAVGAW